MATLFISDLHLTPDEPAVVAVFRGFMRGPARAAEALYILGDFFEYWAGDDDLAEPFNADICAEIAAVAEAGVPVFFMRGNRDFLVGEGFARAARLSLLDEPTLVDLYGTPSLLMHGDTLCVDDAAYQAYRAQVRAPEFIAQFLARPLAERKEFIRGLRAQSEAAKQYKAVDIMDVSEAAVATALREAGVTRLIHGHTHRPARHVFALDGVDCERWVLPDWCAAPGYLECDASGCRLVTLQLAK